MSEKNNLSSTEHIKMKSDGLRGTLKESLKDQITSAIREDDRAWVNFMVCISRTIETEERKEARKIRMALFFHDPFTYPRWLYYQRAVGSPSPCGRRLYYRCY